VTAQNLFFGTKTYILPKNSTVARFYRNLMVKEWEVHALTARRQHRLGQAFQLLLQGLRLCARVLGRLSAAGTRQRYLFVGTFTQREENGRSSPSASFSSVLCIDEM